MHVELKTKSKMFCGCSADYFGAEPNTHTCPVCLGLPGALPVPNEVAIDWCRKIGLALNCELLKSSKFDRKNYFYPDLAKGYQISQYDKPFCLKGSITLGSGKVIGITRVHMEEDTAKLAHQSGIQNSNVKSQNYSLVDFNRSGVPLVEIVTEPDFDNAQDVVDYLKKLQQIVRYLGVSNADMEKGDMRLEPNISLRRVGETGLPKYKVEVKNINSFSFVAKAIEFEIKRQTEILDKGQVPAQETRGWNETKNATVSQRSKEDAQDYRYFPEPDIPEISILADQIDQMRSELSELPHEKVKKFEGWAVKKADARILAETKEMAEFFESTVEHARKHEVLPQDVANYIVNHKVDITTVLPTHIIEEIKGKKVGMISDESELEKIAKEVISENPGFVEAYKKGKLTVIQALVGAVMKKTLGKADASKAKTILEKLLNPEVS